MTQENSSSRLSRTARIALIVLALSSSSILLARCKSVNDPRKSDEASSIEKENQDDPMMALPSEFIAHQAQNSGAPYAQPQVRYIVHESQPEPTQLQHQQAELSGSHQNGHPRQEVSYVLVKPEGAESQPDTPVEEDCNQREKADFTVSLNPDQVTAGQSQPESGRQEYYPGEIVYVSQNGDGRHQVAATTNQHEQDGYGSVVSQSSGVPATILTEVPVRDMPYEVLEKLKREYGVKVVATRERPGANLVINCDDYTGQGQGICSRQAASSLTHQVNGFYSPSNLGDEQGDSAHLQGRELASIGSDHSSLYGEGSSEPRRGSYVTRDGHARVAEEVQAPQTNNQGGYREGFGTRNYASVDQAEPVQPERPDEVSGPVESSVAEEKAEIQPESDASAQDNSFEAQQDSSAGVVGAEASEQQTSKSSQ